jgi:DnaJ-class molecular chaperone
MTGTTTRGRRPMIGYKKASTASKQPVDIVICAFCHGRGRDPFGIMSPLAICQVCGGVGQHMLPLPIAPCAFCGGTGVYPHSRLTCTGCGGIGVVHIPARAVTCPICEGTGRAADGNWPDSPLPCSACRGKGIVSASRSRSVRLEGTDGGKHGN